jgi:hypothetical protein
MSTDNKQSLPALTLAAIGVVYGDIGTSPLYTLRECLSGQFGFGVERDAVFGFLSLIFWLLIFTVSIKYITFVMRADNAGEGGILTLMSLAGRNTSARMTSVLVILGLIGGSFFYGEVVITPAISVMSAIEGLEIIAPQLDTWIVPISIIVLTLLFVIQKHGTGMVGKLFAPIMLIWFLLLAVLGAAWLAAPHVLDWATHTWYTVVKNRDLEAESASRAAASSEAAASSAVQEAASSQPEPEQPKELDGKAITGGSWAAVDVSTLADDAAIRAAAQQLKEQGADYGLVTLKTPDGSICYASQVPAAAQSIADTTVDPARIAAIFREEGVIPVAQLAAFKDPISSRTDRSMAIHYGDGLWLDAQKDGNAWLNPYSAAAVEYVGDLVAEVQGMGFEQVVLTNVQFPKLSRKQDYGETSGVSRADQLKADIAALQSRFAGSMTLWFSYTLDQCNTNSVSLDVPAVTLGMDNLLVTADKAMDADSRTALEQSAAGQGVQHLVLHSADIFQ